MFFGDKGKFRVFSGVSLDYDVTLLEIISVFFSELVEKIWLMIDLAECRLSRNKLF